MSRAEELGYGDPRWMTYRQAQEAAAQVRKGEKGTAIQFWKWQGLELCPRHGQKTRVATRTATRCGRWCATNGRRSGPPRCSDR